MYQDLGCGEHMFQTHSTVVFIWKIEKKLFFFFLNKRRNVKV